MQLSVPYRYKRNDGTRQVVADRRKAYVQGDQPLAQLVAWIAAVMAEGDFFTKKTSP